MRRSLTTGEGRGFRWSIGALASLLVLVVVGLGLVLLIDSRKSIAAFGLAFWRTGTWDPVAGQFGALPFIWGTLYSSALALVLSTPIALGIAVILS